MLSLTQIPVRNILGTTELRLLHQAEGFLFFVFDLEFFRVCDELCFRVFLFILLYLVLVLFF